MTGYQSKRAAAQDKMATKNETLVKRLRDTASRGVSVWGDLMLEAADALEQPSRRPWVRLTDGVMCDIAIKHGLMSIDWIDFARDIEAALRSKNT
jgi:hypothetical protein